MEYTKEASYYQQPEAFIRKLKQAYHRENILPLLLKNFPADHKINILEFGPGLGVMTDILHEIYPSLNYTAIDIDANVLNIISGTHPKAETVLLNSANDLSEFLSGRKFDAIIALDVWEHISPEDINTYTRKSLDALTTGGVFIAQVPNWACPFASNIIFASDTTHCNPFNEISARQLLIRNGVELDNIKILPYRFPKNGIINVCRSLIRPVLLILYKIYLFLLGLQILKICTPNLIMFVKKR